uniref:G-protein coupled receptors family 1 profile domain-containing protein n=1 Tax=Denticeps clupeoides TaxID=299321 RepID=A0AAY4AE89_9TELE
RMWGVIPQPGPNASFWGRLGDSNGTFPGALDLGDHLLFSGREPGTIVLVIMYVASFLVGLAGNVAALLVLARRRNRLAGASATRKLLANLAVCDVMVVCVCMPVNLGHQVYRAWVFGDFLCRAVPFVQAVSVAASVLSLAAISLNRYYSVHRPLHARAFLTGRRVLAAVCAVWAASSALCAPLPFMHETRALALPGGARRVTVCVESWPRARLRHAYSALLFCALYGLPALFNLAVSSLTAWKLWGAEDELHEPDSAVTRAAPRLRMRKKIAKMVLALVVLFTVSWLPLYAVDIWIDLNMPGASEHDAVGQAGHEWVLQGRPFAQWLGLTNSALNPLCYCFVGSLHRSAGRFRRSRRGTATSALSLRRSCDRRSAEWKRHAGFGDRSLSSVTVSETVFD